MNRSISTSITSFDRHRRQAFPAELVDDVEHPELASVPRLIFDEVV